MNALTSFAIAFTFSFIGTLPPGSLNLSIIQLGLDHKMDVAWRFAIAAALIEYPYAWIAVQFEDLITSSPVVTENFQIITAVVMLVLGGLSLWSASKPSSFVQKFSESGFRRGIVLAILNPMALPFWVAMTAYIKSRGWTDLSDDIEVHAYLFGVSLGSLTLFILLAYLAKKVIGYFQESNVLRKIPGITLLLLGAYALIEYLF
jgi:threonine/homoserine/homoserine lactone efflux protein